METVFINLSNLTGHLPWIGTQPSAFHASKKQVTRMKLCGIWDLHGFGVPYSVSLHTGYVSIYSSLRVENPFH